MAFFDSSYSSTYIERNEILIRYFNDIRNYELLSAEQEKEVFKRLKNGDKEARDLIIKSNQRFIVSFAKRWGSKDNLLDLINEGNIGLIKAIDTFDLSRGTRFLTHAVWAIRSSINNYLISNDKIVKPINSHKVYVAANKIKNNFFAKHGRFPTSEEITQLMKEIYKYNIANVEDVYEIKITSIDATYSGEQSIEILNPDISPEFNNASATCNVDEYVDNEFNNKLLAKLLNTIPIKHASIIKMLYGIDELRPLELEEVANRVGMSRERIRQLKKEIITELMNKYKKMKLAV